ncbi:MAG: site-specific DNA-methyltransferase [Deltaproteobacteria bacterium]|nr:site-specific DNA-methyltransferase [Deltaproteobacteria bacterium]
MPKRPTRVLRSLDELPVPGDLCGAGPTRALVTDRGELWHADAMELLGRLDDDSVDLVVADPPYAIAKEAWDEFESIDAYVAWCDGWLAEVARVLAPHGSAYVCGFSEILADVKARSARRFAGCRWLVWYYRNKANLGRDWGRSHESILHLRGAACARIDVDAVRVPYNGHTTKYPARVQAVNSQYGKSGRRDRWEPNPLGAKPRDVLEVPVICNGMAEKTPHATQKPEALIEKLILASSAPGQLVVDPFVGSGTTAAVAARLGRRWLAGDADARYVGLTRDRLATPLPPSTTRPHDADAAPPSRPTPAPSVAGAADAPATRTSAGTAPASRSEGAERQLSMVLHERGKVVASPDRAPRVARRGRSR